MTQATLPLIVDPDLLEEHLGEEGLLIVDLSKPENYAKGHVPGAVHLDYARLIVGRKPAPGLLPDAAQLAAAFSAIGLTPDMHVVAYDDEGGGRACRLLWTLDAVGHHRFSLLDGGLHAWLNERHALSRDPVEVSPSHYTVTGIRDVVADKDYLRDHLDDENIALLDARSPEEYSGAKRFATRGGHIPGAVNVNWLDTMDQARNLRLKPGADLRQMLRERGITPDKEVIVYCQTHHRSAHSYIMLKSLGYEKVKGYAGSWSEWGNSPETPVE